MKHFWYSKMAHEDHFKPYSESRCSKLRELDAMLEQLAELAGEKHELDLDKVLNYCSLKDGTVVLYTECASGDTPVTTYPDLVYLGQGEYHHAEVVGDC